MKSFKWISVPLLLGLGLLALPFSSCSNNSLTNPQPNPYFTPVIIWDAASLYSGIDGNGAYLQMTLTGQPVTNAVVYISSPALASPATLSYLGSVADLGAVYSYYSSNSVPYQAGQPYTFTSAAGGLTAFAAVTAVGGVFTYAPDGSAVSWTVNGNSQAVAVYQLNTSQYVYTSQGNGISPASIPVSVYATPGAYRLSALVYGEASKLSGGILDSTDSINTEGSSSTTIYSGLTPTPTVTATPTSTVTVTPTPTP